MARAHKFTLDTVERLMRGIRMGMPYKHACNHAGISFDTYLNWKKGKFPRNLTDDQKEMKANFLDMITRAEGDAVARAVSTIMQEITQGNADIALKFLERRYPEDFGLRRLEVTGKDGGPIELSSKSRQLIEEFAIEEGISGDQEELVAAVQAYLAGEREGAS